MLGTDRLFITFIFFGLARSVGDLLGYPSQSVLELVVGMGCFFGLWQLFAYIEKTYKKGD